MTMPRAMECVTPSKHWVYSKNTENESFRSIVRVYPCCLLYFPCLCKILNYGSDVLFIAASYLRKNLNSLEWKVFLSSFWKRIFNSTDRKFCWPKVLLQKINEPYSFVKSFGLVVCFVLPVKTCSLCFVSTILTFLVDHRHVIYNLPLTISCFILKLAEIPYKKSTIDKNFYNIPSAAKNVDSIRVGFSYLVSTLLSYVPLPSVVYK